jgi:hypothetical protein
MIITSIPTVYEELLAAGKKTQLEYSIRNTLALNGFNPAIIGIFPEQEPKEINTFQAAIMLVLDGNARAVLVNRELLQHFDEALRAAVQFWVAMHATNRSARILTDYLQY